MHDTRYLMTLLKILILKKKIYVELIGLKKKSKKIVGEV